ncbi:uncharacterized protein LOC111679208 isoform X2 [Lucilia cuprina]|uniref:uncharacterized protein LOC111679208 isoform X2 n=1 Tax=Lucilia cuprina TaxID=7375 RepID=UPI001F06EB11|nr:uncharacterized protein LOC111679208 isoform X2 [Lucilia cuprina]
MSVIKRESTYWQDSERSDKFVKLLDSGLLSDCKFIVGPDDATAETINGHKIMFVLESPVLERMLTGDFIEAEKDKGIRINDVDPHDFKNFCHMIYDNNSSNLKKFTLEEIMELYRICDKYMVQSICETCISYFKDTIKGLHLDRLIIMFEFATNLEDKSLQTAVEKEISTHKETSMVDKLNELPLKVFYDYVLFLSKLSVPHSPLMIFNTIDSYFKRNHLIRKGVKTTITETISEKKNQEIITENMTDKDGKGPIMKMFETAVGKEKEAIMEYMSDGANTENKEINNIQSFKSMLFALVKFEEMTPYEFVTGPGESDLFGFRYKYQMLSYLCTTKFAFTRRNY